MTAVAASGAWW